MLSKNSTLCSKSRFVILLFLVLSFTSFNKLYSQTFYPNPDSIPFAPAINYEVGDSPSCVYFADLDGDGDLDLAVSNVTSYNVSILKNNGDGTFQPKVDYEAGTIGSNQGPHSVFCADLDGDLDLDLATANDLSLNVSILKNNGDGTFQPKVDYTTGSGAFYVYCADLDGDLDLDLAVANINSYTVSILKNNGDGTFQSKVDYGTGNRPYFVFCADIDKDGDIDVITANSGSDDVSILKNNGDGTFQTKVDYSVGDGPNSVFCADLDGDTDLDLAVTNESSNSVSILTNNGDGTFQPKVDYELGTHPMSVFCADLDKDGDLDLAVANGGMGSGYASILTNNGDGTFQPKVDYGAGLWPHSVFCADLDKDGDLDMAVANANGDSVSILKNLIPALVGYWKFDEGTGTIAYDSSGYGNDGTLINDPVWVDGKFGKALQFDGINDYVIVPDASSLDMCGPFTIMAWINPETLPAGTGDAQIDSFINKWLNYILQTGETPLYKPGRLRIVTQNSQGNWYALESDSVLVLNQWQHIAGMWDGDSLRLFKNGSRIASVHLDSFVPGPYNNENLYIGTEKGFWQFFDGSMDEVKIYSRALSEEEIREEFEKGNNTTPSLFSLLSPEDSTFVSCVVTFDWENATDPDPWDTVRYDLYVSTSSTFHPDSTVIYHSLLTSQYTDTLEIVRYYWKVRAYDKYSEMWSNQIWTFNVQNYPPNTFSLLSPSDSAMIPYIVSFDWETAIDPDPWDTVRYDLYVSTSSTFHPDSTIPYNGLFNGQYTDTLEIGRFYWKVKAYDNYAEIWSNQTWTFLSAKRGDANGDKQITVSDVVYLINYLFKGGPPPVPEQMVGDVNCDGKVTVSDVVYLINYLFKGGPPPC